MKTSELLVLVRAERDACAVRLQKLDRAIEALEDLGDEDEPASAPFAPSRVGPVRAVAEPKPVAEAPAKVGRGTRTPRVSDEEFIAAWNEAPSVAAAAEAMGYSKASTATRAKNLRDDGHPLKRFRGGSAPAEEPAPQPSRKPRIVEDGGQRQCLGCFVLVTPPKVRCAVCAEKSVRDRA